MNATDCLIRVENLTREFDRPTDGPLRVLAGVCLMISAGDTIALMGPNGCGKTTLLRIIAGELRATSGEVYINGKCAANMGAHARARFIGRVHQDSYKSLASELTVEETLVLAARRNARLSLRFPGGSKILKTIFGFSEKAATFVEARRNLATRTLSGGQRQLLAIITAILGEPRVLLLDEHQASLDEEFKSVANDLVHAFAATHRTAFVAATHDRQWVDRHVRRIVRLSGGTLFVEPGGPCE